MLYRIVRKYQNDAYPDEVIEGGITKEAAKKHCRDPESSSRTCTRAAEVALTEKRGPWFDAFEADSDADDDGANPDYPWGV